jgi:putative membrane protein
MNTVIQLLIAFIALLHLYYLWLEMFAWTTRGPKIFKSFPKDLFAPTRAMAANQGLYNGFLAAGLIWTFFIEENPWRIYIAIFFLSCVMIAGVYGAISVSKKIFVIQALPALIALILIHLN